MDPILLLGFLQAVLGVVAQNTSIGKKENAVAYLGLLSQLLGSGVEINLALKELTEKVKAGAPPLTDADFDDLKTRSDKASSTIQGGKSAPVVNSTPEDDETLEDDDLEDDDDDDVAPGKPASAKKKSGRSR